MSQWKTKPYRVRVVVAVGNRNVMKEHYDRVPKRRGKRTRFWHFWCSNLQPQKSYSYICWARGKKSDTNVTTDATSIVEAAMIKTVFLSFVESFSILCTSVLFWLISGQMIQHEPYLQLSKTLFKRKMQNLFYSGRFWVQFELKRFRISLSWKLYICHWYISIITFFLLSQKFPNGLARCSAVAWKLIFFRFPFVSTAAIFGMHASLSFKAFCGAGTFSPETVNALLPDELVSADSGYSNILRLSILDLPQWKNDFFWVYMRDMKQWAGHSEP